MHVASLLLHTMQSQNVRAFLAAGMESLMPQAQRLLELRGILAEGLPKNLRRSCSIANYAQGKVVIFADNSAVAAKLRLIAPDLRDRLLRRAMQVTGIEIRVQPSEGHESREKHVSLSSQAARSLAQLAEQLPDSDLKSAVTRVARQHRGDEDA